MTVSERSLGSPSKSTALINKQSVSNIEECLTIGQDKMSITLNKTEIWRAEDLEKMRPNLDLSNKLINFLKKVGPALNVYKRVIAEGRPLNKVELKEEGVLFGEDNEEEPKEEPK